MGRVISCKIVKKPDQLSKVVSGPIQIILRPNLRIIEKTKKSRNSKSI